MRSIFRYKFIILLFILTIAIILAANLFSSYSLLYTILIGVACAILGTIVTIVVSRILDIKPMPWIKTYSDYDKNVQEIDNFLQWLVKSKKVCDLVTLYVRDEMDKNEFNLIAHQGIHDSSPMYGPLVFDDFRYNLDKSDSESFVAAIRPSNVENPKGFRARENVVSRASFKLADKDGSPLAGLYFNWREEQEFTDNKKKELIQYKNRIFSAVEKIKGISIKRQSSNNAELRARRWIDYNIAQEKYKKFDELIFETIYRFFEDFDRSKLKIEIARKDSDNFITEKKDYMTPFDTPLPNRLDSKDDESQYKWVIETTRPKFLSASLDRGSTVYKLIVPIRLPSDLSKCNGIISIECVYKPLIPEMVKPLCYLVDHFGRIEEEINRGLTSEQEI